MADTSIEWTDATWNPVRGCALVSHGCTNCYAMRQAHRFSGPGGTYEGLTKMTSHGPVWTGKVRVLPSALDWPLRQKAPRRIFVNSMSDLFHEDVPDAFICAVFAVMETAQRHTFQILTKRPERMLKLLSVPSFYAGWVRKAGYDIVGPKRYVPRNPGWPLPNAWLGVSVENQETAEERIPLLLQTPAAIRWISAEPLLGPIELGRIMRGALSRGEIKAIGDGTHPLSWIVVGGESGPGARPMHPDWARSLRDQCAAARIPFLFKQQGAWAEYVPHAGGDLGGLMRRDHVRIVKPVGENDGHFRRGDALMARVGKKTAGRELDGRTHDEYPA